MSNSLNKLQEWKNNAEKKKQEGKLISVANPPLQLSTLPSGFDPAALNMQQDRETVETDLKDLKSGGNSQKRVSKKDRALLETPQKEQPKVQQNFQLQKEFKKPSDSLCLVTEKSNAEELVNDVQKEVKFKRYLLKNVDKLKEAISNIEGSIRGIEYIRKRIKEDKPYHKRIKGKIERILLQKMN